MGIQGNSQSHFDGVKTDVHINAKILVVDDDVINAKLLLTVLNRFYTDIYTANDGLEGEKMVQEIKPDLIISDIQMPNLNGIELTKRLKSQFETKNIPILLFSAFSQYSEQAKECGCDDYISKPIDTIRLFAILKRYLR